MATLSIGKPMEIDKSWFEWIMDGWRHVIQVSERTLIDNVAATVPWLAPVSPAYMAWHNAVTLLGWPVWVAWVVAAAIEGLGLSVISTAFQLWKEKRNTFLVAVGTTVFYLFVVITVNVLLELGFPVWIAKALLSLLSVPAAVTIALRSQNAQIVEQETVKAAQMIETQIHDQERARAEKLEDEQRALAVKVAEDDRIYQRQVQAEERARAHELKLLKLQKTPEKVAETFQKVSEPAQKVPETFGKWKDWRKVPESEKKLMATLETPEQVAETYGVPPKTAGNWLKNAKDLVEVL
jgi:hypothetical protein